ncbi:Integral membrane protein DUF6 [Oceaniovalibus guishaninsula JLT2003]|uniref:Integral membrane protein DUF6 n=1 Tax=Oceaniovalibus guishaninsula JLT2003 TaxID=1231392 RepID=K2HRB3_9RHOB|nr:DMT family transporter [Oceaniovalibus guishaninsula]EKE45299.1 Integral membrane protein DUF6 [Oceaniovalibus guishaninsula JLT2003]
MTDQPTPGNWASIAFLGVIWGGTFMVVAVALRGYGPLTVAAARTGFGAASTLLLMAVLGRAMPRGWTVWRYVVPIGLASAAFPFLLLSWGQQYVPSAFAGLAMTALPLFVLPLAHFFSDEPMTPRRSIGVLIGFSGTLLLLGPQSLDFGAGSVALGQLACLTATVCYAAASILTRQCPPVDPVALSGASLLVGAAVLVPLMLLVEGVPRPSADLPSLAILFLGLVPTALAALIRVQVIRTAGSVFMTLVNYQVPLWSMAFGALLLAEALPPRFFAALALILMGLAVSQWGQLRRLFGGADAGRPVR